MNRKEPHPGHPEPRKGLLGIAAYDAGRVVATGGGRSFKLAANETPLGPSPAAIEAFKASAAGLEIYPDAFAADLKQAIAAAHGILPARIVCGAGSDELLSLIARAYLSPGDEAIHSEYGFLIYSICLLYTSPSPRD